MFTSAGAGQRGPRRNPALTNIHLTWMQGDKLYAASRSRLKLLVLGSKSNPPLPWGCARAPSWRRLLGSWLQLPVNAQARPNANVPTGKSVGTGETGRGNRMAQRRLEKAAGTKS
jgi:hypothetical protein